MVQKKNSDKNLKTDAREKQIPEVNEKKVLPVTEKINVSAKFNLNTFAQIKNIEWTIVIRLKSHLQRNNLANERTVEEWNKMVKQV